MHGGLCLERSTHHYGGGGGGKKRGWSTPLPLLASLFLGAFWTGKLGRCAPLRKALALELMAVTGYIVCVCVSVCVFVSVKGRAPLSTKATQL